MEKLKKMNIIISEEQLKRIVDSELDERSRSFAFTRKKRLFPRVAKKYSANRFKEADREVELTEKCWPGYEKKGMKTMFGKRYPNCVKK